MPIIYFTSIIIMIICIIIMLSTHKTNTQLNHYNDIIGVEKDDIISLYNVDPVISETLYTNNYTHTHDVVLVGYYIGIIERSPYTEDDVVNKFNVKIKESVDKHTLYFLKRR